MLKLKHKLIAIIYAFFALIGLITTSPSSNTYTYAEAIEPTPTVEVKRANQTTKTGEHDFYNEIVTEVTRHVDQGTLPRFHLNYMTESCYQIPYMKFRNNISYWGSLTENDIKVIFNRYYENSKEFIGIMQNLQAPVYYLQKNQAIGFYFDGIFLNFLWTSEYLPIETFNLQSITLNGIKYDQQILDKGCSHMIGDGMFEMTSTYSYPEKNVQLNMTPIGGFHYCKTTDEVIPYGVGLANKTFEVTGFEANYDAILNGLEPGEEDDYFGTEYKVISTDNKTFSFSQYPDYQKNAMMQLSSHVFIEITDVECQSMFVVNFGGYEHAVFFNTNLDLDDVYRVDVSYTLASDDKPWYNFIANSGSVDVAKSLTPDIANGGIFGLSKYQGLSRGNFASIADKNKTYEYRLFLNYDSNGWAFFSDGAREELYTNVHNFKILRMNFLYKGQEVECDIKMDEIEGETLSIFDENAIVNADSMLWEYKETAENIENAVDGVIGDLTSGDSKIMKTIYILAGTAGAILLGYGIFKVYVFIKQFIKKKE